jgi:hypothetical protein
MRLILIIFCLLLCWRSSALFADDDISDNVSETPTEHFPAPYSKFQVVKGSISPNGKYAAILRDITEGDSPSKNYLVALTPFRVLTELPTNADRIEQDRIGGLGVNWAKDNSAAVLIFESKFGPEELYVLNLDGDKVVKTTDLFALLRKFVLPDFKQSGADSFNDNFDFFIDDDNGWVFNDSNQIVINCEFTNNPRLTAKVNWTGRFTGIWDTKSNKLIDPLFVRSAKSQ